jgi:hypothetical protein
MVQMLTNGFDMVVGRNNEYMKKNTQGSNRQRTADEAEFIQDIFDRPNSSFFCKSLEKILCATE